MSRIDFYSQEGHLCICVLVKLHCAAPDCQVRLFDGQRVIQVSRNRPLDRGNVLLLPTSVVNEARDLASHVPISAAGRMGSLMQGLGRPHIRQQLDEAEGEGRGWLQTRGTDLPGDGGRLRDAHLQNGSRPMRTEPSSSSRHGLLFSQRTAADSGPCDRDEAYADESQQVKSFLPAGADF